MVPSTCSCHWYTEFSYYQLIEFQHPWCLKIHLYVQDLAVCRGQVVWSNTWAVLKHPLLGGISHQVLKSASAHLGLDVVEPWKHPRLGVKSQAEPAENLTKWVLGVDILTQVGYWGCAGYSNLFMNVRK